MAGLCGLPAERIAYGDSIERALWVRVVKRAETVRIQMMKSEALYIAEAVSRLFRR